jgi:hypothetical protein
MSSGGERNFLTRKWPIGPDTLAADRGVPGTSKNRGQKWGLKMPKFSCLLVEIAHDKNVFDAGFDPGFFGTPERSEPLDSPKVVLLPERGGPKSAVFGPRKAAPPSSVGYRWLSLVIVGRRRWLSRPRQGRDGFRPPGPRLDARPAPRFWPHPRSPERSPCEHARARLPAILPIDVPAVIKPAGVEHRELGGAEVAKPSVMARAMNQTMPRLQAPRGPARPRHGGASRHVP